MTKTQVIALLKKNKDDRGIAHWKRLGARDLKSFGIGLTKLRKLAKEVGRDHKLAQELLGSDIYDARVVGMLIDEPKKMTREQVEEQADDLGYPMFSHIFTSCGAPLPKTPFARDLAVEWMDSKDPVRRCCGYGLLYELGKDKRDKELTDAFFKKYVERIRKTIRDEENWVRNAMNTSLLSIGKRNLALNKATLKAAKAIGPVDVDYGDDNSCEVMDVVKHLSSDWLQEKLKA